MADKRIGLIADYYGPDIQLSKLQEECGELIQVTSKIVIARRLGKTDEAESFMADLESEMADVGIMMDQIQYLFKADGFVKKFTDKKLNRQIGRIETEQIGKGVSPTVRDELESDPID